VTSPDGARFGAELAATNHAAVAAEIDELVARLRTRADALRSDDPSSVAPYVASVPFFSLASPAAIGPLHREELRGLGHRGGRVTAVEGDRLTVQEPA
jgi:hypothetical protein